MKIHRTTKGQLRENRFLIKKTVKLIWMYSKHFYGKMTTIVFYIDMFCISTAILASFMST